MSRERLAGLPAPVLLLVVALLGWIYVHRIAENPPKWEESRRCLVALEMIERGDYVVPRVLGEPYRNKPPLHAWTIALSAGLRFDRVDPAVARAISLAALIAICALLWRLGIAGEPGRPDILPALILATTGMVLQFGRAGEIDLFFCAWIAAALGSFEWGRRRGSPTLQWCLPQLLIGFGVLTKGFAPLFFYPPVLWVVWRYRGKIAFSPSRFLLGMILMLGVVGAWLIPYARLASLGELQSRWGAEVSRLVVGRDALDLLRHVAAYPFAALGVGLPWSLYALGIGRSDRLDAVRRIRDDPWLGLCAAVVGWGVLVYLFVPGTHGRYLIPVLPCFSVLIASLVRSSGERPVLGRLVGGPAFRVIVVLGLAAYAIPAGAGLHDRIGPIGFSLAAGLIAVALSFAWAGRPERLPPFAAALLLLGLVYGAAAAGVWEARSAEPGAVRLAVADDLAGAVDAPLPVVSAGDRGRWLHLGYALSRRLGRTVQARPPERGDYYLVQLSKRPPRWAGAPLIESGEFSLWRFVDPAAAARR